MRIGRKGKGEEAIFMFCLFESERCRCNEVPEKNREDDLL